jgi:fumarate hydratase subunit beta
MSDPIHLTTPLSAAAVASLSIGDNVLITGTLYTARDAAHALLTDLIRKNQPLPFDLAGQIIYYVGPAPARPGKPIGPAGPTTSYRMDPYAPLLIEHGLRGMIGKGKRSREVVEAMKKYRAVYFAAVGGAAALLARSIRAAEIVAYPELGTEAINRLTVKDFPAIVVNDISGRDLYEEGQRIYQKG